MQQTRLSYFPTTFFSCVAALFGCHPDAVLAQEVYQSEHLKMVVPELSLVPGSVKIVSKNQNQVPSRESYDLIQRVIAIWKQKGIEDYMIYERREGKELQSWEIVPYPKERWSFWWQFRVLWNSIFGGVRLSDAEKLKIADSFKGIDSLSLSSNKEPSCGKKDDPFCDPIKIAKQSVITEKSSLSKRKVNVLYNYAPLGKDKLHFLITPKCHRVGFADLTADEYKEVEEETEKLIQFYRKQGYEVVHVFDKTGKRAGQTVPHWHRHIVFTKSKVEDFWGKAQVLKNMMLGSSPLPEKELNEQVSNRKEELKDVL